VLRAQRGRGAAAGTPRRRSQVGARAADATPAADPALIAEGHATRQIAERLFLSVKTVETHRGQIMQRLDIFDVPGLVRFAIRNGLVSSEPT